MIEIREFLRSQVPSAHFSAPTTRPDSRRQAVHAAVAGDGEDRALRDRGGPRAPAYSRALLPFHGGLILARSTTPTICARSRRGRPEAKYRRGARARRETDEQIAWTSSSPHVRGRGKKRMAQ